VVAHVLRTWFCSVSYLNVEGSLESRLSFVTCYDHISVGRAPSNISTCEYLGNSDLLIIVRLMLVLATIKAFRPAFPHSSWFVHCGSKYDSVY
jgi:hypothetical protein